MPKITQTREGKVYLREIEPGKWRASWTDPRSKRHIRRTLPAATFKEAQNQARHINKELAADRGFGGRLRGSIGHTVNEAVMESILHSNANERTRKDYLRRYNPFAEYLNSLVKGVSGWGDLNESIIENYLTHCRREGMAHDTLRMRIYVLRMTSRYMSQTYPDQYRDIVGMIKLRRMDPPKAELDAEQAILSPVQLRGLFTWLKNNDPRVHVWAILQGLCGLRLYEAAYLREQDFDPKASTITITETSAHKPKNRSSYRVIPVCDRVRQVLIDWIQSMKVRHVEGYLFIPTRGVKGRVGAKMQEARVGALTADRVNHFWSDALIAVRLAGVDIPQAFTPRRLRSSFVTAMRKAGAEFTALQIYIGHTPSSILEAHYDKVDMERLQEISTQAQNLYKAEGLFKVMKTGSQKTTAYCINAAIIQ